MPRSKDNAPLRIALVSTRRDWGGGEQQAWLLLRGLRDRGHECHVFARRGGSFAERLADDGFAAHTFSGGGRNIVGLAQLRRHLARTRPHVAHANDAHAMYAMGLAGAGLAMPVRVASRRIAYPIRSPKAYRRFCDRVICVAEAVAATCEASGLPRSMLRLAYSGNRPELIEAGDRRRGRDKLGLDDRAPLLLSVANLSSNKGHRYLLPAFAAVLKKHPRAQLALAGRGDLCDALRQQAERLGVAERVRFLGFRDDVPDLLKAADLLVMASLAEGICGVLAEAMLAGCPVVSTTSDGMREVVGTGAEPAELAVAWPVPPADAEALARAMLAALDAPGERAARATRARQWALGRFTADRMVEANLAVYREVLAEKSLPIRASRASEGESTTQARSASEGESREDFPRLRVGLVKPENRRCSATTSHPSDSPE